MVVRVKLLQVLKDKFVSPRAWAWLVLLSLLCMATGPAVATESVDPAASAVPEAAEAPEAPEAPELFETPPELPAVPDVMLESGWLLVNEESGTEQLVPEPPPVGSAELLYTGRFDYLGAEPATGLRIEISVPEGVHYVAGSATGPGAVVTYSVDGVVFAPAGQLDIPARRETLQEGVRAPPRPATPEDYGFIRWDLPGEFPPGAAGLVSFRARPMIDESDREMPGSPESESVAVEAPPEEAP